MAETGTSTEDLLRLAQQLSVPDQTQAPAQPQVARPSSIVGLLGSALGGGSSGSVGLTEEQANAEGRSALLNFGLNMLEGSGPSSRRRSLGQIFAGGVRGAQGAIGDYESQIAARQAAALQQQQQQITNRREALATALPLLKFTQEQKNLADAKRSLLGGDGGADGGGGGPDPVASMPKEEARQAIIQRESGGQNIFSKIKVPGRSQEELGSGYYQIIPSTWREGAQLAGVDTSKYPLAINAPREVQDRVFDALWGKYGAKPWASSAPKAAPGAPTTTTAATTPPDAKTPPAASTPGRMLPPGTPTPPEPPAGMLPSPEPAAAPAPGNVARAGPSGTQVAGPPGVVNMRAARPAGPEVQGDVNAIIAGMTGAGADAETLQARATPSGPPGTQLAGAPTANPSEAAKAQARATNTPVAVAGVDGLWAMPNGLVTSQRPPGLQGGPAPSVEATQPPAARPTGATAPAQPAAPGEPPAPGQGQAEIGATPTRPHPFQPTLAVPPDDPRHSPDLTPEDEKGFSTRLAQIESDRRKRIAFASSTDDVTKAQADADTAKAAVIKDRQDAMRARVGESKTSIGNWQKEERDRQYERYKSEQFAAEPSDLARAGITPQPGVIYTVDNFGKIAQQKVEIDPRLQKHAEEDFKSFQTDYQTPYNQLVKVRPVMDQMDILRRRIQANGGAATGLTGQYLRIAQQAGSALGFLPENIGQMTDVQALESLSQQAILSMKANVHLGNTSNQDMERVAAQIPNMMQTLAGQEKLSAILKQLWNYQERTYKEANKAIRDPGTGYTFKDLDERIAKLPPAIPSLPPESESWKAEEYAAWKKQNKLEKGMVYFMPDGTPAQVMR